MEPMIAWTLRSAHDVPSGVSWLGPRERAVLAGLRTDRRRADWLLGRFAAKTILRDALAANASAPPASLEIVADDLGAPRVLRDGVPLPTSLSISHRAGLSLCALAGPGVRLGCDLELVEARSAAFVEDYFTDAEQELLAVATTDEHAFLANLLWSAKESALKALGIGLRLDTRALDLRLGTRRHAGWRSLRVLVRDAEPLPGWWRRERDFVLTVVGTGIADARLSGTGSPELPIGETRCPPDQQPQATDASRRSHCSPSSS